MNVSKQEPSFNDRITNAIENISELTNVLIQEKDIEKFTEKLEEFKSTLFSVYIKYEIHKICFEKLPTDFKGNLLIDEEITDDSNKCFQECIQYILDEKKNLLSAMEDLNIGEIDRNKTNLDGKKYIIDVKLRSSLDELKKGYNTTYSFIEDFISSLAVTLEEKYVDLDLEFFAEEKPSFIESISYNNIMNTSITGETDEDLEESLILFKTNWEEKLARFEKVKSIIVDEITDLEEDVIDLLRNLPKGGIQISSYKDVDESLTSLMSNLKTLQKKFPQIFQRLHVVYQYETEI